MLERAASRVRDALGQVASTARSRTTLVVVLVLVGVAAAGVFAYLVFRRQTGGRP